MSAGRAPSPALTFAGTTHVYWQGRRLLYFGGCDYLRLSHHPMVHRSLRTGLKRIGLNVAASRLTTGNHPIYAKVEEGLARFFQAPTAQLVPTGYMSNLIVAQAVRGMFTHGLIDDRAHASLGDASEFLHCPVRSFQHRDADDLARRVRGCGRHARILVMTDGMFAYDGSAAPLRRYRVVLPASAWLLVDDAHGAGVLGRTGRGTLEHEGLGFRHVIQTVTLSKGFGTYGGAILAPGPIHRRISEHSRLYAGSTPVPLPLACAALTSLKLVSTHQQWLRVLHQNTQYVRESLKNHSPADEDNPGPIVSLAPSPSRAVRLRSTLLANNIYPTFLNYPGGPSHGYFRFAISHVHQRSDLDRLISVLKQFA